MGLTRRSPKSVFHWQGSMEGQYKGRGFESSHQQDPCWRLHTLILGFGLKCMCVLLLTIMTPVVHVIDAPGRGRVKKLEELHKSQKQVQKRFWIYFMHFKNLDPEGCGFTSRWTQNRLHFLKLLSWLVRLFHLSSDFPVPSMPAWDLRRSAVTFKDLYLMIPEPWPL